MATVVANPLSIKVHRNRKLAMTDRSRGWQKIFSSVRTRILIGYILLMFFSAVISIVAIRHLLYVHLEKRIEKELIREVKEFQKHTQAKNLNTSQAYSKVPAALFKSFVSHEVMTDKYYIFLADGKVYQTANRSLPSNFHLNAARFDRWSKVSKPEQGEIVLSFTSIIYYLAIPIKLEAGQPSVFIVLFDATGECEEINQAILIIIEVSIGALFIAFIIAWIAIKRTLMPLRLLTTTASIISDTDLTERIPVRGDDEIAELTTTFNEMLDRLQASFDNQKNFLNHAGHELRTPLRIIRVNLELLSEDPQEQKKTIELVTDELDRMSRYVNDMILLAKAEQPDFLILETVNLNCLTEEIYSKATALGERNWQLEKIGKGKIVCDRHRLTQVLMNLVQNATQQTQTGDAIAFGSMMKDGMARFWVRDTGSGIDPRVHKIIFDRFIRCPTARQRFEGMGLGLAIVKAIVEAHRGRIELQSEMDIGSTFTIIIAIDPPREIPHYLQ
jgi:signal transduction histidine kinase